MKRITNLKKRPLSWLLFSILVLGVMQVLAKDKYRVFTYFSTTENSTDSEIVDLNHSNQKTTTFFDDNSISAISLIEAQDCNNDLALISTVLISSSTHVVKFYADPELTIELNSNFTGHGSTTYSTSNVINTYRLDINNLDRDRVYYAARVHNNGTIVTEPGNGRSYSVNRRNIYINAIQENIEGCGVVNILDAIQPLGSSINLSDQFSVYKLPENTIVTDYNITSSGQYRIEARDGSCPVQSVIVNVIVKPLPNLFVTEQFISLPINTSGQINANTTTSSATINYINLDTNQTSTSNQIGPFSTPGDYNFQVSSSLNGCENSVLVTVSVFDPAVCPTPETRIYANESFPRVPGLGFVTNSDNSADGNTDTFATLTSAIGILGLGSSYVDLKFPSSIPSGTPITIKLGTEYGALSLLSGVSVYGVNINSSGNTSLSSNINTVDGSILGLLNGVNEYEYTFVPRNSSGNISVNGVRVVLGGVLSVAGSIKVFDVYYKTESQTIICGSEIIDVLSGTRGYGLNVANNTVGVNNPRYFTDSDPNNYSRMYVGLGVAADAYLAPIFNSLSMPTDIVELELRGPNNVLDVSLLNGLFYRRFNGNTPIENVKSLNANLISLTLLSGNQNKYLLRINDPVSTSWDKIELRLGGVVSALNFLDVFKIERKPRISLAQVDSENYSVCRGTTLILNQSYCTDYKWFSTLTGSDELSNDNSYTIPNNLAYGEHTFYIQAIRFGCEVMTREAIKINVIAPPNANDIAVTSPIITDCSNSATIEPTNINFNNEVYRFYTDQQKTQEINSSFAGHQGVVYNLDNNILSISNLDVPRTYYISMEIPGTSCTNQVGDLKEVVVNLPERPEIVVNANLTNCGFVNLYDAITNYNSALTYTFFTLDNEVIQDEFVRNISQAGTYFVEASDPNLVCSSQRFQINVNIIPGHNFTVTPQNYAISLGETVTINYASQGTVIILDQNDNLINGNTVGPFNTIGQYVYTLISTLGSCTQTETVIINVTDPNTCYPMFTNVYATSVFPRTVIGLLGNIDNVSNIVDADNQNYATLISAVNLLGLGSVSVDVVFADNIPLGTPVTLKLGTGSTLLSLANGLSVQGINRNLNSTNLLGNPIFVNGRLLGLIGGENVYEFTFIPRSNNQNILANGVRITLGGLVSVAESARVYSVHYQIPANQPIVCPANDLVDVLYGTLDLGLGVANALVNVTDTGNLLDSNPDNYALMNNLVGVLTGTQITGKFATVSAPTDIVKIKIGTPGTLLNLSLLSGLSIQKYLGTSAIGSPIPIDSNLISLELLSGNNTAEIIIDSNDGSFDRVRLVRAGAVSALEQLRVYSFKREPKVDIIGIDQNPNLYACAGQVLEIEMTDPCTIYKWYDSNSSTANLLHTGNAFTLPQNIIPGTYTYYVQANRNSCDVLSRSSITVQVIAQPNADDIDVDSILTSNCENEINIAPNNLNYNDAIYKFYTDQSKSNEILTGFTGHQGLTYTVENNVMSVNGIVATMNYFISMEIPGTNCSNSINDLKQVTVNPVLRPEVITNSLTACQSVNLFNAITNFDSNLSYTFYNNLGEIIPNDVAVAVEQTGIYFVSASNSNFVCASELIEINVTILPGHNFVIENLTRTISIGETSTINFTSEGTVTIFDSNNNIIRNGAVNSETFGPFNATGINTYRFESVKDGCTLIQYVIINVIDPTICPLFTTIFPNEAIERQGISLLGSVTNEENIVGSNLSTYATLNSVVGLLGLGSTYVDIFFENDLPLGTPLTVKLGGGFGALSLATGVSVQPITKVNNSTQTLGEIVPVNGNLIGLLSGQNVYEYTFVPSNNGNPIISKGVRVRLGSLVTLLESIRVYSAYYQIPAVQPANCQSNDIYDVLYGNVNLGVDVANSLNNVVNAENLLDSNPNNFATMNNLVGIGAGTQITAKFSSVSSLNDIVKFKVETPGTLLNLSLLSGVSFQKYLGAIPVGEPILSTSNLIRLNLLSGSNIAEIEIVPNGVNFDGIRIVSGGLVGLLEQIRIYEITRYPSVELVDLNPSENYILCSNQTLEISSSDVCTIFRWYDGSGENANLLATGNSFTLPNYLLAGQTYTFYVQAVRFGCEVMSRTPITFTVLPSSPANAINVTAALDAIDKCSGNVTLNATLTGSITQTNPIFEWYSFDGTDQNLVVNNNTSTLNLTGLQPGSYTYFVGVSSDEFCMSTESNRVRVDFTIPNYTDPNTIQVVSSGNGCQNSTVTLTASSNYTNSNYTWFLDDTALQPITSGVINGITYIVNNNQLSISGLTALNATYFVALSSDETCANLSNLKQIDLNFNAVNPPVLLNPGVQNFCSNLNSTLADILMDQPNIIWYDALTGGNVLNNSTLLVNNGNYFAAVQNAAGCESVPRTQVIISIETVGLPVDLETLQTFCSSTNPTIANLSTNSQDIIWYLEPINGLALPATNLLVNGQIYYAALISANGCEGLERQAVTVNILDVSTPTTNFATQSFCSAENPTISNLSAQGNNVVWYDAPGGNAIASNIQLINGSTYYGYATAQLPNGTQCISTDFVEVTVVLDNNIITGNVNQIFCASVNPTVGDLIVNQSNVIWYSQLIGGTALNVSEALLNGQTYYADFSAGCTVLNRFAVNVTIENVQNPTTDFITQTFCRSNNPTIANLQVNGSNIVWYDAPNGNILDPSTLLTDGTIYYAYASTTLINDILCLSNDSIAITVSFTVGSLSGDTNQEFCEISNPTISNLVLDQTNILWYSTSTGGNALDPNLPLINGQIYYADYDSTSCALSERFQVSVSFNEVGVPTLSNVSQSFCLTTNPTVSDLQVQETNVIWYNSPQANAVPLQSTDLLVNGSTYYVALIENGCESKQRLAVQVVLFDGPFPTNIPSTQTFCSAQFATIQNLDIAGNTIIWKDASGAEISGETLLTNGSQYYAHGISSDGCESSQGFEVTVVINDVVEQIENIALTFCTDESPTVANLQDINVGNWFSDISGNNQIINTTPLINGQVYYSFSDENDRCNSIIYQVNIIVNNTELNINEISNTLRTCLNQEYTYQANEGFENYIWLVTGGNITAGGQPTDNYVTVIWSQLGNNSISLSVNPNSCLINNSEILNVNVEDCEVLPTQDLMITKTVDNTSPIIGSNVIFTIVVSNNSEVDFTDITVDEPLNTGFANPIYNPSAGSISNGIWTIPSLTAGSSATLLVTVKVIETGSYLNRVEILTSAPIDQDPSNNFAEAEVFPEINNCLIVYNEISPNGDGLNDFLMISCIDQYPNTKIQIFNRYGSVVYKKDSYNNDFNGIANVSGTFNGNKELPSGTYYYILEFANGTTPNKSGWLYIMR